MKIRKLNCVTCKNEFNHPVQRGRLPSECPSCKDKRKTIETRSWSTTVTITCRTCGNRVTEPRRPGKSKVHCASCREAIKAIVRTPRVPKEITPVINTPVMRNVICSCGKVFKYVVKRGKPRTRCDDCKANGPIRINNKSAPVTELSCIICDGSFPKPKKRGKYQEICPTCLNKAGKITDTEKAELLTPVLEGEALADHLDKRLRALGIHLSQHSNW